MLQELVKAIHKNLPKTRSSDQPCQFPDRSAALRDFFSREGAKGAKVEEKKAKKAINEIS